MTVVEILRIDLVGVGVMIKVICNFLLLRVDNHSIKIRPLVHPGL